MAYDKPDIHTNETGRQGETCEVTFYDKWK